MFLAAEVGEKFLNVLEVTPRQINSIDDLADLLEVLGLLEWMWFIIWWGVLFFIVF